MASLEYKEAVTELLNILENTDEELVQKIPAELIVFWEENKSEEYIPELDHNLSLEEMKLKTKTRQLLAMIYYNYLCDADKKKEIKKIIKENEEKQKELEELDGFNINLFNEKAEEIKQEEFEEKIEEDKVNIDTDIYKVNEDIYMIENEENSVFFKIVDKIKRLLRKIIYR